MTARSGNPWSPATPTPRRWTVNGNICQTSFGDLGILPRKLSITELQVALANLNNLKGNVQNCNCAPSNCCQSAVCQSCQTATCQSQACQSCQSQGCQSCQSVW